MTESLAPRDPADDWAWYEHAIDGTRNPSEDEHHPGYVKVQREMNGYRPDLTLFIEDLHDLAQGLEDPEVWLEADLSDEVGLVFVHGRRAITEYDRGRLMDRKRSSEERERAEYEALKAKFEGPLIEGDDRA